MGSEVTNCPPIAGQVTDSCVSVPGGAAEGGARWETRSRNSDQVSKDTPQLLVNTSQLTVHSTHNYKQLSKSSLQYTVQITANTYQTVHNLLWKVHSTVNS
jgi:hypothetical protein